MSDDTNSGNPISNRRFSLNAARRASENFAASVRDRARSVTSLTSTAAAASTEASAQEQQRPTSLDHLTAWIQGKSHEYDKHHAPATMDAQEQSETQQAGTTFAFSSITAMDLLQAIIFSHAKAFNMSVTLDQLEAPSDNKATHIPSAGLRNLPRNARRRSMVRSQFCLITESEESNPNQRVLQGEVFNQALNILRTLGRTQHPQQNEEEAEEKADASAIGVQSPVGHKFLCALKKSLDQNKFYCARDLNTDKALLRKLHEWLYAIQKGIHCGALKFDQVRGDIVLIEPNQEIDSDSDDDISPQAILIETSRINEIKTRHELIFYITKVAQANLSSRSQIPHRGFTIEKSLDQETIIQTATRSAVPSAAIESSARHGVVAHRRASTKFYEKAGVLPREGTEVAHGDGSDNLPTSRPIFHTPLTEEESPPPLQEVIGNFASIHTHFSPDNQEARRIREEYKQRITSQQTGALREEETGPRQQNEETKRTPPAETAEASTHSEADDVPTASAAQAKAC